MDTYTLWNLKRAPHTVPGEGGAQSVLRSCRLGSPAAADAAGQRCRSTGHRRGRRGAAGPQARSLPAPSPSPRLSRLTGEKPGLYPGTGRKQQPNCSSDRSLSFTTTQVDASESSVLILAATYFSSGATLIQSMKGCSNLSSSKLNKTS